ncbi:MAG: hypothetical protein GX567_14920 [Clostridia bacterium]|nr:hypothetical protein [Clostridia bacterium]
MKKEIAAYYKNAIRSKKFALDLFNMILGIAIIILTVFAFSGNYTAALFPLIFFLGFVLTLLNALISIKEKGASGIMFLITAIIFLAMSILCLLSLNHIL